MRDEPSEALVESIVDELTRLRKERGLSHASLAELTGLSRPAISFVESHTNTPTILTCVRIAKALDVKLSDVIAKFEK